MTTAAGRGQTASILLFNDECTVCRTIGHWVKQSARQTMGDAHLIVRPIGDDPDALRTLNPRLDIWEAYDTIHILMPDGSMKTGGEAVAEVLRDLPNCRWFAWTFNVRVFGVRPFQSILDLGYVVLSDLRPVLGCESCGMPNRWVTYVAALIARFKAPPVAARHPTSSPHAPRARSYSSRRTTSAISNERRIAVLGPHERNDHTIPAP